MKCEELNHGNCPYRTLSALWICLVILLASAQAFVCFGAGRAKIVLNANWTFNKGDVTGAQATNFNDAAWTKVNLPHVFDTPYYASGSGVFWYVGIGWYRKHFNVQAKWISSNRIFLEFEAAFQVAQVYVNGSLVGRT